MLAQSHARQPAPPLAARGMWLRLHGGADAFGSALGDAVVGSIVGGDQKKAPAGAVINYDDADMDGEAHKDWGAFSRDTKARAAARDTDTPDWARPKAPTVPEPAGDEPFDFRRESLKANARSAAESQAREDFRRSEISAENAAAKARQQAAAAQLATWDGGAGGGRGFINPMLPKGSPNSYPAGWNMRDAFAAQQAERDAMPVRIGQGGSPGAYMLATPASRDAQTRYEANTLGIALLGPVFGALPAAARVLGAPESVVENFAQINFDLGMAAAGMPRRSGVAPVDYFPRNGTTSGNTSGRFSVETGAKPDLNEIRAGVGLGNAGYDVTYQATASSRGISNQRTADLYVSGVGAVDVYTPQSANPNSIVRAIEKKNSQAGAIIVQSDLTPQVAQSIAGRVYGKPSAGNIQTLFFQGKDGVITTVRRPQ